MRFYSLFDDIECKNADKINQLFSSEASHLLLLFEVINSYLNKVNGKIINNQYPEHTILNLSAQNLQLINSAYILFTQGYLRSPAILLRTVSEQLILCMFFKEFREKEKEYREKHYSIFFHDNKIDKMLSMIDKSGKVFKVPRFTTFNYLNRMIYKNLFEELSYFVHTDINIINNIMYDESVGKYHKSPRLQDEEILKSILAKLYMCALYTILIIDKTFEPEQDEKEIRIITKATKIINSRLRNNKKQDN